MEKKRMKMRLKLTRALFDNWVPRYRKSIQT